MKQRVAKCTAMVLAATVVCSGVLPADMHTWTPTLSTGPSPTITPPGATAIPATPIPAPLRWRTL